MILIQVGRRRLNLWYLVMDEESGPPEETPDIPPGVIRVTMERGVPFFLAGGDADSYRRQVIPFVHPEPGQVPPGRSSSPISREVDSPGDTGSSGKGGRRKRKGGQ